MKLESMRHGDRKVYTVSVFNRGIARWLERLPTLWVEGEVTELRRHVDWQSVFLTLKDQADGSTLSVTMPRRGFDALRVQLRDGDRIHVYGRPELFERRGAFQLRALTIEPFGVGDVLAHIERLKKELAAEGLFSEARKRPLPVLPRRIGLLTGAQAAAKRDFLTAVSARFPGSRVLVAETSVQGPQAPAALARALDALAQATDVDVIVLARGGGSFEDLLPFSDERLVRAVATSVVPVVSAVGHEQDTPLCDLASDARASTPTAAARLVVPDEQELRRALDAERGRLLAATVLAIERARRGIEAEVERLARAPARLIDRKRSAVEGLYRGLRALSPNATLARGYAIVRKADEIVRAGSMVSPRDRVSVQLRKGSFVATVEEVTGEDRL